MRMISRIEEIFLLAIWRLGDNAYGITIRKEVQRVTAKKWALGAIYAPLDRLRKNQYVLTDIGPPTGARGGRHKILYRLTPSGQAALAEVHKIHERTWAGIAAVEFEKSR
jgi:PadR family transcriptional regulator, regulatory protein PadR